MANESRPTRQNGARLGAKLIGATLIFVALSFVLLGAWTLRSERAILESALDSRGQAMAFGAASSSTEMMLEADYAKLQTVVDGLVSQDPDNVLARVDWTNSSQVKKAFRADSAEIRGPSIDGFGKVVVVGDRT